MSWLGYLIPTYSFVVLLIYGSFLYVFGLNFKAEFKQYPFYLFVPCLAFGDISVLLVNSLYMIVYQVLDENINYFINQFILFGQGLNLTVYISVLIALNRFCVLVSPEFNEKLFSKRRIKKTILAAVIFWVAHTFYRRFVINCDLVFEAELAHSSVNCGNTGYLFFNLTRPQKFNLVIFTGALVPIYCGILILLLYFACFVFLVHQRLSNKAIGPARKLQKIAQERRLLCQGVCIGMSLVVMDLVFLFSTVLPKGSIALAINTNALVTPLTFLAFNKVMRECFLKWLGMMPTPIQPSLVNAGNGNDKHKSSVIMMNNFLPQYQN